MYSIIGDEMFGHAYNQLTSEHLAVFNAQRPKRKQAMLDQGKRRKKKRKATSHMLWLQAGQ
jgi:hypothetical protein